MLGIGTPAGASVPGAGGRPIRDAQGQTVISALQENELAQLAGEGRGIYRTADYRVQDTRDILDQVGSTVGTEVVANQKTRVWHERYYWLVGLMMLLLLSRFRRLHRLNATGESR